MLLLLFAQTTAQQASVVTGGSSRKKRTTQLAPVYSPTPAPEYWAAKARQKRRNSALIIALSLN